jgi:hypothetical protein
LLAVGKYAEDTPGVDKYYIGDVIECADGNFLAQAVKGFTGIHRIQNYPFQRRKRCYSLVNVIFSPPVARTNVAIMGADLRLRPPEISPL